MIRKVFDEESAILLQNTFPTLEKYIDHIHMRNGKPAKVPFVLQKDIEKNFKYMIDMKRHGNNMFFTDIDKIKEQMLKELR